MNKKICILGLGYIGIPTAAMFAKAGFDVIGVDVNKEVVDAFNKGEIIIEEPNLDILIKQLSNEGKLKASTVPVEADVFIVSVPTPINKDKTADMTYIESATNAIVPFLKKGDAVILESTSPPQTVEKIMLPILSKSNLVMGEDVYVAHSPERVIPGRILIELVENNRIIGGINQKSAEYVRDLYKTFVKGEIYLTDATTAEMCKLMENTFRDVNIALANELAKICEKMGINAWDVIQFANKHPRVNLHQPGPGVGGHCIAVDPWFIVEKTPELANIINLARVTNDSMPAYVAEKVTTILKACGGNKVTILGVTYKPDTDDMRESPVVELIEHISHHNIAVSVYDPHVKHFENKVEDLYEAAADSSLVVLAVNHKQFADVDFEKLSKVMKHKNIVDTRNFFDSKKAESFGFNYSLLGKN